VTLREAHESPEGMDAGTLVTASQNVAKLIDAIAAIHDSLPALRRYGGMVGECLAGAVSCKAVYCPVLYGLCKGVV